MKKLKKGFTLIELIAVLVIMAILALIVTPLVMNIIRKARVSADKRSVDAYGRSIELAIAGYLLDTGTFPTDVSQLTIEYSGNKVECETTQINPDSSVYLTGCRVAGRTVDYAYGKDLSPTYTAYTVGNQVSYNGVDYYVIKDSGVKESTVTLLKAEPITSQEISPYLSSTEVASKVDTSGTYVEMAYYSSENCFSAAGSSEYSGCSTDYSVSDIKQVVDAWAQAKVSMGLEKARLIKKEEIDTETREIDTCDGYGCIVSRDVVKNDWMYNSNYSYWTMSPYENTTSEVWKVNSNGSLNSERIYYSYSAAIRPVIVLSKAALSNLEN